MWIWALFAGLTAVAVLIVLAPLARTGSADAHAETDVSVYRDQLAEVDRDLDEGLVGTAEAEAARAEIGRRVLRAARRAETDAGASTGRAASRIAAALVLVLVPALSVGGYLVIGRPDLPDAPLAQRLSARTEDPSVELLVARVEAHLAAEPGDVRGWEVLGPVYMKVGRPDAAARAWRTAIDLAGPTERRAIGLGEALVAAAEGAITPEAQDAFRKALTVAPASVLPRMYLAAALSQDDKHAEAAAAWKAIVASGTEADPWMSVAREEQAKAEAAAGITPAPAPAPSTAAPAAPGPTAAEVEAAGKMSTEDRTRMVADMVGRLEERLKTSGGSIDDWDRLIRSLKVMGRAEDAKAALDRARAAFASDSAALARLDALAAAP